MHRFYWLIENGLAGCSRPGEADPERTGNRTEGAQSQNADLLDSDLMWLRQRDIGAVLSLTETPLPAAVVERYELEALHLPVPDLRAPLPDQFVDALAFIDTQRSMSRSVAVHCLVGQGRTATILAAYLIRGGMSADEAIAELRSLCPGAIGSQEQERALHAFADRRDWIV